MGAEAQANHVSPPKRGQLLSLAATTTTAFVDLTALVTVDGKTERTFCNRYLTLTAVGADLYVVLSQTDSGDIDETQSSAVDGTSRAPTPTADLDEAILIVDGQSISFLMESETTPYKYLAYKVVAGGGTAKLIVWPSSPREIKERR
jgi:hypothetical protein